MLKRYKLGGLLLLCFSLNTAQAAPKKIESFAAHSWQQFQQDLARPAAVVFTSTECAHCPAVIASLAELIKNRQPQLTPIALIVVVMDGAGQPDLLQEPHYRGASRLLVFQGQAAQLQYGVNPDWRGITPYVALLARTGATKFVLGKPSKDELRHWLAASGAP